MATKVIVGIIAIWAVILFGLYIYYRIYQQRLKHEQSMEEKRYEQTERLVEIAEEENDDQ